MTDRWSAELIGSALCRQTFKSAALVVPECNWTGNECDLLVVEPRLRIIDVEIKISRADLRADVKKYKWWHNSYGPPGAKPSKREWPQKVWKHYVVIPAEIWHGKRGEPDLAWLPSPASGLLVVRWARHHSRNALDVECLRRATPNKEAKPVEPAQAIDIARLASLRAWDAYEHAYRKELVT